MALGRVSPILRPTHLYDFLYGPVVPYLLPSFAPCGAFLFRAVIFCLININWRGAPKAESGTRNETVQTEEPKLPLLPLKKPGRVFRREKGAQGRAAGSNVEVTGEKKSEGKKVDHGVKTWSGVKGRQSKPTGYLSMTQQWDTDCDQMSFWVKL